MTTRFLKSETASSWTACAPMCVVSSSLHQTSLAQPAVDRFFSKMFSTDAYLKRVAQITSNLNPVRVEIPNPRTPKTTQIQMLPVQTSEKGQTRPLTQTTGRHESKNYYENNHANQRIAIRRESDRDRRGRTT